MKSVLVIEDDRDLRELLRVALNAQGFTVIEASTSDDADAATRAHSLNLVVVDGLLPDGSGVDWIARFRSRNADTPILFMSAYFRDWETFRHLTNDLNVGLILYKPLDPEELAEKARALATNPESVTIGAAVPRLTDPVQGALAELRRDFAERLPGKVDDLAAATEASRLKLEEVAVPLGLAHRLRGTAGSYGFAEVGEAAGLVEDLLRQISEAGSLASEFLWTRALSAVRDTVRAAAEAKSPTTPTALDPSTPATRAVLVVHHDPDVLALARDVGRQVAVAVVTAETGAEGIQLAARTSLVGALLEIPKDPDRNAFNIARDIRAKAHNSAVPIAFTSKNQSIETRVGAIEAGGSRFFDTPISAEGFASLLQQFESMEKPVTGTVLVVDDDVDALRDYAVHLRGARIRVEFAESPEGVFERLETISPDVVILDVNLPHVSGLDVCRAIRMSDRWEMLPVLVATTRGDRETRLRAFRAGASDVLAKPILPDELLARVGVQLDRLRLVRERSEKDALSGLLLRRPFLEALKRSIALAAREEKPVAITLLDLDHFKAVNDDFGHGTGDAVIAGIGRLLRQRFRVEDLRGRWGGEEFILAFPGQTGQIASQLVTRLLREFQSIEFPTETGEFISPSFSAGVAEFPADGTTVSALLRRADERLYAAKREGRARVTDSTEPSANEGQTDIAGEGARK